MNIFRKGLLFALAFVVLSSNGQAKPVKGNEFDAVCKHIKTKYKAKKVKIPSQWLIRTFFRIVRPGGIKSLKVAKFKNLQFPRDSLHKEMQAAMRDSFSDDWSPVLRVRLKSGFHVYMNMRESGKNIKTLILLVDIDNRYRYRNEAFVIRAKFRPDRLAKFIENPKIFGVSLSNSKQNGRRTVKKKSSDDKRIINEDDSDDEDTDDSDDEDTDDGGDEDTDDSDDEDTDDSDDEDTDDSDDEDTDDGGDEDTKDDSDN